MKKITLSPFFAPLFVGVTWGVFLAIVLIFMPEKKFELTENGHVLDIVTYTFYGFLFVAMFYYKKDFKNKKIDWYVFLFLSVCAFLREAGIQHHLSKTDTTPFKSRFFLNPNNPLSEKIIYGLLLLVVFSCVLYLAIKYSKHLIVSFLKLDTITWSIATLCTSGVLSKIFDRIPSNYRHNHNNVSMSRDLRSEEHTSEL